MPTTSERTSRQRERERRSPSRQEAHGQEQTSSIREIPGTLKFFWGLVLAGLIILLFTSAYLSYYNLQSHCEGSWESQNVKVALNSPEYASVGDMNTIDITAVNARDDSAIITVKLIYLGSSICLTEPAESQVVNFGKLSTQERATRQVGMQFPLCINQLSFQNLPGQLVQFEVWLTVEDQPPQLLDTVSLHVMPIPLSKKLSGVTWALFAGLSTWALKELWGLVKESGQPAVEAR